MTRRQTRTRDERRGAVLDAAARILSSADVSWHAALTYDELELESGIDRSQISNDFGGKSGLVDAVLDHCLDPISWLNGGEDGLLANRGAALFDSTDIQLAEFLYEVGLIDEALIRAERRLYVQMAIWGMGADDPSIREKLRRLYEFYDGLHVGLAEFILANLESRGFTLKKGLTLVELIVICTAIAEGLAIRYSVSPETAPEGLSGRAFIAMFESMVEPIGADGELGDIFRSYGL